MELFNYRDNCRLCLKTHTDLMKNIFTHCVEGYQDTLVQNIFALFKVELNSHKDFPQFICRKCLTEVENILLFKEDLQRNQDLLFSLFTAAYPNCIEKNLHIPNHSKDFDSTRQSVAINTDPGIDFRNLGDSEYVRVPVNFLKQFSPQIIIRSNEVGVLGKKSPEIKEEIAQDDSLSIELSVNICKYCNKAFRSQTLVNTHCKEVHKLEEQQRNDSTRKRISNGLQKPWTKKIKTKENVSLTNMPDLSIECGTFPEMDLENNNACGKEELHSPPDQQVDKILAVIRQQRQALFLQNFNLIAKQEAASIKTKQKSLKRLSKRRNSFKKQIAIKKTNKPVVKPLQFKNSKNKMLAKPLKKNAQEILCRSVQFLKRYGWRKLYSSSRQGTSRDKTSLFQHTTKSASKKGSPKNSIERSVLKEKSSERAQNLDNFDKMHELPLLLRIKVERNSSMDSSRNRNSDERSTCTTNSSVSTLNGAQILKESASTSTFPDKIDLKPSSSKICEDVNTKLKIIVKDEPLSSKGAKAKEYKSISSRSFYDKNESSASVKQVLEPNLAKLDSCQDLTHNANSNKTKLPLATLRKSEPLLNNRLGNKSPHNAPIKDRKPKHFQSVGLDSFMPTNDLEIKKELQIRLGTEKSSVNHGFSESSFNFKVEEHNSELEKNSDVSYANKVRSGNQLLTGRGRPKSNSETPNFQLASCSKSSTLLPSKKKGRSMAKQNIKDELIPSNTYNHSQIFNDDLTETMLTVKSDLPKRGRPKRIPVLERCSSPFTASTVLGCNSPLLNLTQSLPSFSDQKSKNPSISTLQDLNDRYEQGDNIGLRMKLRKTATSESLNRLKYDTQELDENFQIKVEAINELTNMHYNDVPEYITHCKSHDKGINKNFLKDNIVVKSEEASPEKVVNVDLEDSEVLMLVPRSEDDIDFDNEDNCTYVKSENYRFKVEPSFMCSRSNTDLSLEAQSSCPPSANNLSDNVIKQFKRSQTFLSPNEHELIEFDVKPRRKGFRKLSTNNESCLATSVDSKSMIGGKRKGRPPTKYSPSIYAAKRSRSIADILTRINDKDVELTLKKIEPRSRSTSQTLPCAKDLFNTVKNRVRAPKADKVNSMSSPIKKNGSLNKPRKDAAKPKQERSSVRKGKCSLNNSL